MTDISIFDFEDKSVRTVSIDGEPWFVGRDVCRALEIKNESDALGRLDDDERRDGVAIADPIGRKQSPILISEPGVYNLVFTSRTEVAQRFKRWLRHDVLPSLRQTGSYSLPGALAGTRHAPPLIDDCDIGDLHKKMMIVRETRLTLGVRAARETIKLLSLPFAIPRPADDEHSVTVFADDALVREIGGQLTAAALYQAYLRWCGEKRLPAVTQTAFGRRMAGLGFGKLRTRGNVVYTDVDLAATDTDADTSTEGK